MFSFKVAALVAATLVADAQAETHTVAFTNNCGRGTPLLKQNGNTLSSGSNAYTSNGPLIAAIAYLDVGCGANGEGCTLIETTLVNPTIPGAGSSSDISLIPPHTFSVASGFGYYNGCDGAGADCNSTNCPDAFHQPDGGGDMVPCQADNVNLAITFCD